MALSDKQRAKLVEETKEAAAAFIEDMDHMRAVVSTDTPSKGDIRRISAILRRLLVNRDIALIASPRTGKVQIEAPDLKAAYGAEAIQPFLFFASGQAKVLGGFVSTITMFDLKRNPIFGPPKHLIPAVEVSKKIELPLESFLRQNVLKYRNEWISRESVIKYVANVASGVHSGAARKKDEITLSQIRSAHSYRKSQTGIHCDFFKHGIDVDETAFSHSPDSIDPVLVELLASATFFVGSPFVIDLEKVIQEELS